MLTANHSFEDFNISGSVAVEQWDTRSGYHKNRLEERFACTRPVRHDQLCATCRNKREIQYQP